MANKNIKTFEYSMASPSSPGGKATVYTVAVVDQKTGKVESSIQTSDHKEAQKFYDDALASNSNVTVNGGPPEASSGLSKPTAAPTPAPTTPPAAGQQNSANPGMEAMKKADAHNLPRPAYSDQNQNFLARTKKESS